MNRARRQSVGRFRRLLLGEAYAIAPWTEAFLFEADRAQTYSAVIIPALDAGHVVVSDRNLYGTIAYQAFGRNLDVELVDMLNRTATQGHYPDLVLLFDAEPEITLARKPPQGDTDRFDRLDLEISKKQYGTAISSPLGETPIRPTCSTQRDPSRRSCTVSSTSS